MKQIKDLHGQMFGKWKVLNYDSFNYDKSNHKRHYWLCECQCKNKTIQKVEHTNLLCGQTNSCRKCINMKYNVYNLTGEYGIGYTRKNEEFYFDLEDYDKIKNYCWHKHKDGYLRARIGVNENGKNIYKLQHILIYGEIEEHEIDHKNRLPNDNRKLNLRHVTHNYNMKNYGKYKNNTSGVIGVFYSKNEDSWKSYIQFNNKRYNLDTFTNITDAIISRLTKEKELYESINKKPPQKHLFEHYNIK